VSTSTPPTRETKDFRTDPGSAVGKVRLAVSDLNRSLQYYTETLGLEPIRATPPHKGFVQLGARGSGSVLLELEQLPGIRPLAHRKRLGIYHFALLLPTRAHLSSFVAHLQQIGASAGSADHLYSEALYLVDPDGISIEVYADRPREDWIYDNGELIAAVQPLNFEDLLRTSAGPWRGMPAGTKMGHIHFYVGDLGEAARFYHQGLGLEKMTWRFPGALFVAAGGYHHHVGLNTWAAGSQIASQEDARLLFWEFVLPSEAARQETIRSLSTQGFKPRQDGSRWLVTDPWGINVALVA
jgi:catechol 2,3-dioxygenase